jgi:hypothetical protein
MPRPHAFARSCTQGTTPRHLKPTFGYCARSAQYPKVGLRRGPRGQSSPFWLSSLSAKIAGYSASQMFTLRRLMPPTGSATGYEYGKNNAIYRRNRLHKGGLGSVTPSSATGRPSPNPTLDPSVNHCSTQQRASHIAEHSYGSRGVRYMTSPGASSPWPDHGQPHSWRMYAEIRSKIGNCKSRKSTTLTQR